MGCGADLRREIKNFGDFVIDDFVNPLLGFFDKQLDFFGDFIKHDLLGLPENFDTDLANNTGILVNKSSNVAKIPIIYGVRYVGGVRVFMGVSGASNEYLHIVLAISDSEVSAIGDIYLDDLISTDSKFTDHITITKYTGTTTQAADSDLVSAFTDYETTTQLKGVVYVHCKLKYNQDVYSSIPRINVNVTGRKIYNPITSTVEYTNNNAAVLYDYLTNGVYGKGLSPNDVDQTALLAACNYCEILMQEYSGGGNIKYFEFNGVVDTNKRLIDNVSLILASFRAFMPFVAGKYKIIIEKDETPVFDFNKDNIIDGSWSFSGTDKKSKLNRVKASFANPDKNWQSDIVVKDVPSYLIDDNNILLEKTVSFPYETNQYRARWRAETIIKRSRQGITVSFKSAHVALVVEVGDVVTITHDTPGWSVKKFRVVGITILPTLELGFSLIEHEPTVYDRTIPAGAPTEPDTNLPNPFFVETPTTLQAYSGTNDLLLGGDGSIVSRIRLTWASSGDIYVTHFEIQYKLSIDSVYQDSTPAIGQSVTQSYIVGVKDSLLYDLRIRAVNNRGVKSAWATLQHKVIGKTAAPPDVDSFFIQEQNDGTRQFNWNYASKPVDHLGFEIRYGFGSSGSWGDLVRLHDGVIYSSPWETNLLLAGEYIFAIKAIDTTLNYSDNALFVIANLGDPRLTESIVLVDFKALNWPGTLTNCFINEDNVLEPTSPTTWGNGGNWEDVSAWNDGAATSITYEHTIYDIGTITTFKLIVRATYNGFAVIQYKISDDNVTYSSWTNADGAEVSGRYVKVKITITDSNNPMLLSAVLDVSAKPIEQLVQDLDTSTLTGANRISVGHVKLPLTKNFNVIKGVTVTLQNVGPGWSVELISKLDLTNGPEIKIYNASNSLTDATIDAVIRGA